MKAKSYFLFRMTQFILFIKECEFTLRLKGSEQAHLRFAGHPTQGILVHLSLAPLLNIFLHQGESEESFFSGLSDSSVA